MATTTIRIKKVCEWCGKEFEAQRCSTRFCSKACTDHAYKKQKRQELKKDTEIQSKVSSFTGKTEELKQLEFLSVADAAQLLNVTTRAVYNLIYRGTLKAYRLSQQWTVIRKEDLTAMIEARPYERKPRATTCIQAAGQKVTEFYTTQEIMEKFGVSNSWVFAQGKAHHIPKVFHRGKTLWSKTHCDRVFAAKQEVPQHEEWISYTEVRAIYQLTHDQIYSYVKYHGLRKKKVGKYTYILRSEIDAILQPPTLK